MAPVVDHCPTDRGPGVHPQHSKTEGFVLTFNPLFSLWIKSCSSGEEAGSSGPLG
jgi:hypothetical protein